MSNQDMKNLGDCFATLIQIRGRMRLLQMILANKVQMDDEIVGEWYALSQQATDVTDQLEGLSDDLLAILKP